MTVFRDYYEKFVHKILCPEYLLNGLVIVDNIDCVAEELEKGSNGSLVIDYFDAEI